MSGGRSSKRRSVPLTTWAENFAPRLSNASADAPLTTIVPLNGAKTHCPAALRTTNSTSATGRRVLMIRTSGPAFTSANWMEVSANGSGQLA